MQRICVCACKVGFRNMKKHSSDKAHEYSCSKIKKTLIAFSDLLLKIVIANCPRKSQLIWYLICKSKEILWLIRLNAKSKVQILCNVCIWIFLLFVARANYHHIKQNVNHVAAHFFEHDLWIKWYFESWFCD